MTLDDVLPKLRALALTSIEAERFPEDSHRFWPYRCQDCGVSPFTLTVEHHTGSRKANFRGIISGVCSRCGNEQRLYSFTGSHRRLVRSASPKCRCGHRHYWVGECERIEGDEGLSGFVDEGVVVALCDHCGRPRVLARTD